jgi:O-antigen/teichoic acid export membrane protein
LGLVPFLLCRQIFSSLLQTQEKIAQMNLVNLVQGGGALLGMFCFVFFMKRGVVGGVIAYLLANALAGSLAVFFSARQAAGPWRVDPGLLRELVADGAKLHIGIIGTFIFFKIDQLMLGYYKASASVGFYSIAVSLSEILFLIPIAIQNVFYAKIVKVLGDREEMAARTLQVYKHNLILLVLGSVFLAATARFLIGIFYGSSFLPSIGPFFILLPGAFFLYANNVLINYLVGLKRFFLVSFIMIAASALNIVLNVLLIPGWGGEGAALASTVTYLLVGCVVVLAFLRHSPYSSSEIRRRLRFTKDDVMLYKVFIERLLRRRGVASGGPSSSG